MPLFIANGVTNIREMGGYASLEEKNNWRKQILSGNLLGLHDELQELVKAGLSPMEALETATINPASYFGLLADYGSIATGKVADMVLLDANPVEDISNTRRIDTVIFNGNVYTREELDQWLAYIEKNASSIMLACKLIWQSIRE